MAIHKLQNKSKTFSVPLKEIQPSQLFLSASKLASVLMEYDHSQLEALSVPVLTYNERMIFSDGHTRAFAAFLHGIQQVNVYQDEDELDQEMYEECVKWCKEESIISIGHLRNRILDQDAYAELWIGRCQAMHQEILTTRSTKQRSFTPGGESNK